VRAVEFKHADGMVVNLTVTHGLYSVHRARTTEPRHNWRAVRHN